MSRIIRASMALLIVSHLFSPCFSADWPQFRGPNRDGISAETGLLKSWPAGGPEKLWVSEADLSDGFSSVSVVGDSIYTTGTLQGEGWLFALDRKGRLKWKKKYGPEWTKNFPAARTTPTVDDGLLYIMSGMGLLACYDTAGGLEWSVDTDAQYGLQEINWGIAECPLVYDDTVICTPGGTKATMVAFNKKTGKELWTCSSGRDTSAYCSPALVREGGKNLIVTMTSRHVIGVEPKDGTLLWSVPYPGPSKTSRCGAHPNTPVHRDDQVYVTTGYNDGGLAVRLSTDGRRARRSWAKVEHDNHHGGVILCGDYLYGSTWKNNRDGNWMCIEWEGGKTRYDTHWKNKGCMIYAEGMLYCYTEKTGHLALVAATPEGFEPVSSFTIEDGTGRHWAHPAISDGILYLRHGNKLVAFAVKADAPER